LTPSTLAPPVRCCGQFSGRNPVAIRQPSLTACAGYAYSPDVTRLGPVP
jgi:hypothetical protein